MTPAARFIAQHCPIQPVPHLPQIRLHLAVPQSGVWRLAADGEPPYWAWCWPGGLALTRHIAAHPDIATARRVIDLGTGSGLVAIAAAMAGAAHVTAIDTDPHAIAATTLNAALNGVTLTTECRDPLDGPAFENATICVGDLFYADDLAFRVAAFLDRCIAASCTIWVGDIGRAALPRDRLTPVSSWAIADFGQGTSAPDTRSVVYRYDARL